MFTTWSVIGGTLQYKKGEGVARLTLWKELLRGTKILFCGCGLKLQILRQN